MQVGPCLMASFSPVPAVKISQLRCLAYRFLRPGSLAFLPNAQLGRGMVAPMHHVQVVGPHINPHDCT